MNTDSQEQMRLSHPPRKRIVVLDDDELFGRVLTYQLKHINMSVIYFSNSKELFEMIESNTPVDLFILDVNLGPRTPSGLDVCRKLKAIFDKPIIMLTGDKQIETLVSCLSAGADQYIVKPCDVRELKARIESTIRLYNSLSQPRGFDLKIQLDQNVQLSISDQQLIGTNGKKVQLSQHELSILELLISANGGLVERDRSFKAIFGYSMDPSNRSIDLNVSRLRTKLQQVGSIYDIKSVRGRGYKLLKASSDDGYMIKQITSGGQGN